MYRAEHNRTLLATLYMVTFSVNCGLPEESKIRITRALERMTDLAFMDPLDGWRLTVGKEFFPNVVSRLNSRMARMARLRMAIEAFPDDRIFEWAQQRQAIRITKL